MHDESYSSRGVDLLYQEDPRYDWKICLGYKNKAISFDF